MTTARAERDAQADELSRLMFLTGGPCTGIGLGDLVGSLGVAGLRTGKRGVEYFGMVPATTTVPVGSTLTFRMSPGTYETHTATFGPGKIEDPNSFIGKIAQRFEGAVPDPSGVYPSDPTGAVATLAPTFHGNGFWNSGTPLPVSSKVTFGAPGTYTFYCLIHPFMKGDGHGSVTPPGHARASSQASGRWPRPPHPLPRRPCGSTGSSRRRGRHRWPRRSASEPDARAAPSDRRLRRTALPQALLGRAALTPAPQAADPL